MNIVEACFKSPSILNVRRLVMFLEETVHKTYSDSHIIKTIFQTENIAISKQWASCHLLAAIEYLKMKDSIDHRISEDTVRTVIADLTNYIRILNPNFKENIPQVFNDTPPGLHYRHSNHLFERGELDESSRTHVYRDLIVILMMRTAFERKIKSLLGISYLKKAQNKSVPLFELIELLKELEYVEFSNNVNWVHLLIVNKWMNFHIHQGLRPHPWIIFKAISIFDSLISPPSRFQWYKDGKSIHDFRVRAVDKAKLRKEILEKIKEKYQGGTYDLYEPRMSSIN